MPKPIGLIQDIPPDHTPPELCNENDTLLHNAMHHQNSPRTHGVAQHPPCMAAALPGCCSLQSVDTALA